MADQTEYRDEVATFGDRLAAAREGLGLSQEDLARRIGVRRETLAAWEDDRREPRANRLALLAGVTGAPLRWLLSGEGETPGFVTEAEGEDGLAALVAELGVLRVQMVQITERAARLERRLRAVLEDRG